MPGAERARLVTPPASPRTGEPDMIVLSEADIRALVDPVEAVALAADGGADANLGLEQAVAAAFA